VKPIPGGVTWDSGLVWSVLAPGSKPNLSQGESLGQAGVKPIPGGLFLGRPDAQWRPERPVEAKPIPGG
jgi:hypothetical protein